MKSNHNFYILSIDGGGIRGVFAAHILKRIQEELNIKFYEKFDLIAGTSTGSIIAAALAIDYPIEKIVNLYLDEGQKIFEHNYSSFFNFFNWKGFFKSKYKSRYLKSKLADVFGETTLSQTKTNLLIPATDISNGNVFVFKSNYDKEFVRDINTPISSAVLSSCSAPTYFKPNQLKEYLLADGGLWSNNPSLVALTEAMGRRFNVHKECIRILSIGTGGSKKYYDVADHKRQWGLSQWGLGLLETIMNLQSVNVVNIVNFILEGKGVLRINFEAHEKVSLDDLKSVNSLVSKADEIFTYNFSRINDFLNEEV